MKEIRNYKNIRRKPKIFGFTPMSFIIFCMVALLSLSLFLVGFSWVKLLIVIFINFISLIVNRIVMGEDNPVSSMFDEKFPEEISSLTKK